MTGAYIRVKRNGKMCNVDELLTDKEMAQFASADPEIGWKWAIFFAKYLRDSIKPLMDGLVQDGILEEGK